MHVDTAALDTEIERPLGGRSDLLYASPMG
jgi:hypothetical protein